LTAACLLCGRHGLDRWRLFGLEPHTPCGEAQQLGVAQHRVVALVVGHHHQRGIRVPCSHVTQIERQVEIQRVLALAGVRHQRHPLVRGFHLLGTLGLVGAVEQPHVRQLRRDLQQVFHAGLHILKVNQCVQFLHFSTPELVSPISGSRT
jgi:hypothetical protein